MKTAVYIGRFRPPHIAHIQTMKLALAINEQLVILIGSSFSPRNIKNPFTFCEIEVMIRASLTDEENERTHVKPIVDHMYDDSVWLMQVQRTIGFYAQDEEVTIFGYNKDETSYYLDLFPQWGSYNVDNVTNLNATDIRELLFSNEEVDGNWMQIKTKVPHAVYDFLHSFFHTEEYKNLQEEFLFLKKQNAAWDASPYPPMFITTDAVVECAGHVLMIKRTTAPGKGLWALPGGFLKPGQRIVESMVNTTREKTKLDVARNLLEGRIRDQNVFDHPRRSLRGRTVTHAYHINLFGGIPNAKSKDAKWFSFAELSTMNEFIFEDHLDIICHFTKISKELPRI